MNKYDVEFRDDKNNFFYIYLIAEDKNKLIKKLDKLEGKVDFKFFNLKETKNVLVKTRKNLYEDFIDKKKNKDYGESYNYFSDMLLRLCEDYGGDWSALPDGEKTINTLQKIIDYFSRRNDRLLKEHFDSFDSDVSL